MKRIVWKLLSGIAVIGAWAILIYGCISLNKQPSDDEIRELINGQWTEHDYFQGSEGSSEVNETRTYKPDGTLEGAGATGKIGTPGIRYCFSGTWKVQNGVLSEHLDKGDLAFVRRQNSNDIVLHINSGSMQLRIPDSDSTYWRHKAQK
ncbi:MAG TPA: hypothetical protein VMS17_26110 [Gemmataceae bacterium]|nr:hypothetical protein [Gemmataceae bacterium]